MLTHRNLLFASHCYYADIDYIDTRDTILHAAPLTHGSGLYGLAHIARGGTQRDPRRLVRARAGVRGAWRPTPTCTMFAAPTMVSRLINHPRAGSADTRGLKTIIYGGAPMYLADLKRALELFGPKLYNLYGQGESPMTITGLDKAMHADSGPSRMGGAACQRRRGAHRRRREDRRRGRTRAAAGRDRRDRHPQRLRDAGLLEQSRSQRQGRCATAGCGPATSAPWMPTASSPSRTAPRT